MESTQAESALLVVLGGPEGESLARRLGALGLAVRIAPELGEALAVAKASPETVVAAAVPVEADLRELKSCLKSLAKNAAPRSFTSVVYGSPPDPSARRSLRSLGVRIALWEPFDDGTLRFQANRALGGEGREHGRVARRVPTFLLARVRGAGRDKEAVVYSLSETGAFLETARANMDGAHVEIHMRLPDGPLEVRGEVAFANVPGNLQRPNLPLGMGIRFEDPSNEVQKRLAEFIARRAEQIDV